MKENEVQKRSGELFHAIPCYSSYDLLIYKRTQKRPRRSRNDDPQLWHMAASSPLSSSSSSKHGCGVCEWRVAGGAAHGGGCSVACGACRCAPWPAAACATTHADCHAAVARFTVAATLKRCVAVSHDFLKSRYLGGRSTPRHHERREGREAVCPGKAHELKKERGKN